MPEGEIGHGQTGTPSSDDGRPEWWVEATAPIPAGHISFEQVAALTGADEPSSGELTFPLAGDPAGCKLVRPPNALTDPCSCGPLQSCARLRALWVADSHVVDGEPCGGLPGRCPTCIELYRLLVGTERAVCMICGHKHWPWDAHADHQWRDDCPYEGTACGDRS